MLIFNWDKSYETDIDLIDDQHKKLVDIINEFGENMRKGNEIPQEYFNQMFDRLSKYANEHFKDEEDMMKNLSVDLRHVNIHKKAHKSFFKQATKLFKGMQEKLIGNDVLFNFLSSWLSVHILIIDKILARQIKAIKDGQNPKLAYEIIHNDTENTIGPLLIAINQLFDRTLNMSNELLALNRNLEKQVKARTKELEQSNNILRNMALTDVLTGLGNRRAAVTYLQNEWDKEHNDEHTITCIMIDADNFKQINDTEGHEAGDKLLVTITNTIKNSIRNDDFFCRLGGDEFVILSNNTNLEHSLELAEYIREQVEQISICFTKIWHGSVSIGVAAKDDTMNNYIDLLKKADDGLYIAKRNGKNKIGCAQKNITK